MSTRARRVVKVGGSLFSFAELPAAWRAWHAEQPPADTVLLAGGGPFADAVRAADQRFRLGEERSHWLCVETLRVSARLLADLLPECPLVASYAELRQRLTFTEVATPLIFCPAEYLREVDATLTVPPLPYTWAVTSDTIAARLATVLAADELVLLKSQEPPAADLAGAGYVDEYFAAAACGVPRIRYVNLRDRAWRRPRD